MVGGTGLRLPWDIRVGCGLDLRGARARMADRQTAHSEARAGPLFAVAARNEEGPAGQEGLIDARPFRNGAEKEPRAAYRDPAQRA